MNLLDQIQQAALDSNKKLTDALRACIALGSRAGSSDLTDWAKKELYGYDRVEDVPAYRKIVAPLLLDGVSGNTLVRGQALSPTELPDFVRQTGIDENLPLVRPLAELEESAKHDGTVMLGIPGSANVAGYMNAVSDDPYNRIDRIYWGVSPTVFVAVLDQVRTTLLELVVEIRQGSHDAKEPSAEAVTNAVNVAVYGKRSKVTLTTAQSSGSGSVTVKTGTDAEPSTWWTTVRIVGAIIVGVATILAAYFGWLAIK